MKYDPNEEEVRETLGTLLFYLWLILNTTVIALYIFMPILQNLLMF